MTGPWEKYLATVSDQELARYISRWETARQYYPDGSYGLQSLDRALAEAYALRDRRQDERR